ncbi:MAG: 3-phosphoshikimate 1-carboxyvinyltransferase, partial [Bacteroidales bacterium]
MTKSIHSSRISGTINAPSSKSIAQRAIIAALLVKGTTHLHQLTLCTDTQAALQAVQSLGAKLEKISQNSYCISSDFFSQKIKSAKISCGESG